MVIIAQDTFIRANQPGWGTASDGQIWTEQTTSGSTFSIASNEGTISGAVAETIMWLGTKTSGDMEGLVRTQLPTTTEISYLVLRATAALTFYRLGIADPGGVLTLEIVSEVAGTGTSLISSTKAITAGVYWWIRGRVQGTSLYAKTWQDGTVEPGAWDISITDTSISGVGNFGVRCYPGNVTDIIYYDHFSVDDLTVATPPPSTHYYHAYQSRRRKGV